MVECYAKWRVFIGVSEQFASHIFRSQ